MTQIKKILDGIVVSDKAEKTIIVSVSSLSLIHISEPTRPY